MTHTRHWSLGAKLLMVGAPFMLLVFMATVATLWVSWQLDGGAAAVNEAGRMRMQSYRLSLSIGTGNTQLVPEQAAEFDRSLATLKQGDPNRPLFVPWDDDTRQRFAVVETDWARYQQRWIQAAPQRFEELSSDTVRFAADIDHFVNGIEVHLARWTALLHLLQLSMLGSVILGATVLLYTGYMFVLEPVGQLKQAIEKIQLGDFEARVARVTSDEFGTLAEGFNGMAEHLQSMYRNLESKVAEKTRLLQEKSERLASLYEVTALVTKATSLDTLAQEFTQSLAKISHADGVALRWSSQGGQRYLLLATHGLPPNMVDAEQCIYSGDCACGSADPGAGLSVIPIHNLSATQQPHCARAGFETLVTIPVRLHGHFMGEVDLFFHARTEPTPAERSLFEALSSHLASGMENLRLNALEKEAAVSQERHLLARELHDSIAQSLAFLKIQVQLMRDALKTGQADEVAKILEEIDVGVKESYGDVRELLLHFRTRTNTEDIEPALATTLQKFELQSGIKSTLSMQGQGLPLSPDVQIQVLHILQEALSNIRKHAHASQAWLDVQQQPSWRFEVRDDGIGFNPDADQHDQTHVGLRIMAERAQRIGAQIDLVSTPLRGSSVILTLPSVPHPSAHKPVQREAVPALPTP
ncbi:type IV pili methyl-accepting chemotaxis transducer N-terminal domain-containing protein [Rhodoferax sp. U2-2l]|uniref:type IV pili methyl-accepting chemotaxis transducer N-terminal domain-containing protein n=1 Tax=Rhodoferax sp. U2-2l TaxID=2884000 RepID=UPI001D099F01|nr:type IV pili methyl-accepting chemotaxis transducer N-terminal domain-containing protein [Rhodoferax sp. U2-2l]MCB8748711.1 type IV pili methyl-accepting chemotaxis transducer N-terminal domain-containing protein [Rhodoferax sp. U2-2l]